ncbi:MAG: FHA domain-containing serine/threonine-protein kinase [Chloroflexota bacterium]
MGNDNLQTFGRYQLEQLIHKGTLGDLYRAIDTRLGRSVAVKVIHEYVSGQPEFKSRFVRVARRYVQLDHPGLVRVLDFGEEHAQSYIATELLPEPNLETLLDILALQNQWIGLSEAITIVTQVAEAVEYACYHRIQEQNIAPNQIMFKRQPYGSSYRPQPVCVDLPLDDALEVSEHTQLSISPKALAYMPPEEVMGEECDQQSQAYRIGLLLYQLATGTLPHRPRTISDAIDYFTHQEPIYLPEHLPNSVIDCLTQTLNQDRKMRPLSIAELTEQLYRLDCDEWDEIVPDFATAGVVTLMAGLESVADLQGNPASLGDSLSAEDKVEPPLGGGVVGHEPVGHESVDNEENKASSGEDSPHEQSDQASPLFTISATSSEALGGSQRRSQESQPVDSDLPVVPASPFVPTAPRMYTEPFLPVIDSAGTPEVANQEPKDDEQGAHRSNNLHNNELQLHEMKDEVGHDEINAAPVEAAAIDKSLLNKSSDALRTEAFVQVPPSANPEPKISAPKDEEFVPGQDQILVLLPDGMVENTPIEERSLIVGRSSTSDIMLNDPRVSRTHLRITHQGSHYQISDLGSANGTSIADKRMKRGQSIRWHPDMILQLGSHKMRLLLDAQELDVQALAELEWPDEFGDSADVAHARQTPLAVPPDPLPADILRGPIPLTGNLDAPTSRVPEMLSLGSINEMVPLSNVVLNSACMWGLYLPKKTINISPDAPAMLPIIAINSATISQQATLQIQGLPPNWIALSTSSLSLLPNEDHKVVLHLTPPQDTHTRTGEYQVQIQLLNPAGEEVLVQTALEVKVTPFGEFQSILQTEEVRLGNLIQVFVANRSNTQQSYIVDCWGENTTVDYEPREQRVQLLPGEERTIQFETSPKTKRWFGSRQECPFTVQIYPEHGHGRVHHGKVILRSRIFF